MNKRLFSHPRLYLTFIFLLVLAIGITSCGGGAPMEEPAAASETTFPPPAALPTQSILEPDATAEVDPPSPPPPPLGTQAPAIPEHRRLTLEFPPQIRAGDSDVVRLTLEVDELGNITPTAQFEGNVVTGEVIEIPNLYETHFLIAEAKFDIAGLQVYPSETISQIFSQGQAVTFYWSVLPESVGVYRGTIWFYLTFIDKVSGEEIQKTVSAQIVEIEAVNLLGLPANLVRTFGGVGSVVGAVIGLPFFDDILKFVFGRRKRKK